MRSSDLNAPAWVLALCVLAVVIVGLMMWVGIKSRVNDLLASMLCLIFAALGFWVSVFSPSEGFSGGIPFLPSEHNVSLARWVFGIGAVISLSISVWAFRRYIRAQV